MRKRGIPPAPTGTTPFVAFESGPVRPIALSSDGTRLFVTNIPDNRLEIFDVDRAGLHHAASVPVGLEPVTVAVRSDREVWVVNHLSDSVSIVDVGHSPPRVTRTLLVGDEPRDLVFAGPNRTRAFITTAHRGQQRTDPSIAGRPGAGDPELTTPGVGRADVWVFDADQLGDAAGGVPLSIVPLFGDTPRALAVGRDGRTVYAAVFQSGNQTTTVHHGAVCPGFDADTPCEIEGVQYPGGVLGPATNYEGAPAPHVGIIVKYDSASGHWLDTLGRKWDAAVRFRLPDQDVFAINARTLRSTRAFTHVGTTLFNMVSNPRSNALYVSNTEARNDVRFEGPGVFGGSTVQGRLAESRITVIDTAARRVRPRHLNKHIDYSVRPAPPEVAAASLATPLDMAITRDGGTLYVAAFGSSKVGVLDTAALEADALDPRVDSAGYIAVSGGGPSGLALDDARHRLYVYTRFDNGVSVVDTRRRRERAHVRLFNPEPPHVVAGRRFLYDAAGTSSNGEASCASCHIFGDHDGLAWDLGNPDAPVTRGNPLPINLAEATPELMPSISGTGNATDFHPMKGPMVTQTLRGMVNSGAMHWRGDRVIGHFGVDTRTAAPFDSDLAFRNFVVAFPGLLGRASAISDDEMAQFSAFALALTLPPNPQRKLDNSLTAAQLRGKKFYLGCDGVDSLTGVPMPADCMDHPPIGAHGHFSEAVPGIGGFTCQGCHTLDPANGFFGTSGLASFDAASQIFKIPHLRNLYTKIGMFGMPAVGIINPGNNDFQGDQIRGFGFLNDGSVDTPFRFINAHSFDGTDGRVGFSGTDPEGQRRDVEQWLLAFDTDLAPVVGQQVTLTRANAASAIPRLELLRARAGQPFVSKIVGPGANECDLVASAVIDGIAVGWLYRPASSIWEPDDGGKALSTHTLTALATGARATEVTFTAVPPGSGARVALDRDSDGVVNRRDRCSDDPGC
ncbi:YncE family protein [Sorangium sp. So ce1128]